MDTHSTKLNLRHAHAFAYDGSFEARLLDRIVETIVDESMFDDSAGKPVLVPRTGETAAALISALASVLALSPPAAHSSNAIKQTASVSAASCTARSARRRAIRTCTTFCGELSITAIASGEGAHELAPHGIAWSTRRAR